MIRGQSGGSGSPGKPHWWAASTKYKIQREKKENGKKKENL